MGLTVAATTADTECIDGICPNSSQRLYLHVREQDGLSFLALMTRFPQ